MTSTVRALRWHAAGDLRLDRIPVAEPGEGQVQVAVKFCGICGSDLHEILDGPHAIPVDEPHPLSTRTAPIILGHEFSGTVTAVGDGVVGIAVGDAVVIEPSYRCGRCAQCLMGRYHTCEFFGFAGLMGDGGMAERVVLPAYMIHVLPMGFDLAVAAVLEPAAVALHAVRRSSITAGGSATVVGLGPVGLLVGMLLRIKGVESVVGIDLDDTRRGVALSLGFDAAEAPSTADASRGADVSFEVVGNQRAFATALSATRAGGVVMLLGLTDALSFGAFDFVNQEKTLRASVGYNDCHAELIELCASGTLDLRPLITATMSLSDAPAALLDMAGGRVSGIKTLIDVGNHDR